MSKKVQETITRTNGYRCGCCGRDYYEENWIEESEMISFIELIDKAILVDPSDEYSTTAHQYYDEFEQGIYGFSSFYGRDYCDVYISIGEQEFLFLKDGKEMISREELIQKYKGEDK